MNTRQTILRHALAIIESEGLAGFSTRAVCRLSNMTAPTLYHHFGSADGLLSAAVILGFDEFLARKLGRPVNDDPVSDLLEGWDDYVAFARERPQLYSAMTARLLACGDIPAATKARQHLSAKLQDLEALGRLCMAANAAAEIVWSTAHAAALLHVAGAGPPQMQAIAALRNTAASVLSTD